MKPKKVKFRLVYGYGKDQHTPIKRKELAKVLVMFFKREGRTMLDSGYAIRAEDIMRIEPDWYATMGWSGNHTLTGEDFDEIGNQLQKEAREVIALKQDVAKYLIANKMEQHASLPTADLNQFLPELLQTKLLIQ